MTGPCGTMLNQAGLNKLAVLDNSVALAVNVALEPPLDPEVRDQRRGCGVDGRARPGEQRSGDPGAPAHRPGLAVQRGHAEIARGVRVVDAGRAPRARARRRVPAQGAVPRHPRRLRPVRRHHHGPRSHRRGPLGVRRHHELRAPRRPATTSIGADRGAHRAPVAQASVRARRSSPRARPARLARRFRRRRHLGQTPGSVDVVLDELVSPLRYDVVIRQEFFAFLDANVDLLEEFGDLVLEAHAEPYYVWFRDVMIGAPTRSCSRAGRWTTRSPTRSSGCWPSGPGSTRPTRSGANLLLRELPAGTTHEHRQGHRPALRAGRRLPPHRPPAPPRAQGAAGRHLPAGRRQAGAAGQHRDPDPETATHRAGVPRLPRRRVRRGQRPARSTSWSPASPLAIPSG